MEIPYRCVDSRKEAIERERKNEAEVKIYTDGSRRKGRISAAVVLFRRFNKVKVLRKCLCTDSDPTCTKGNV